jgi:hypothetical protein
MITLSSYLNRIEVFLFPRGIYHEVLRKFMFIKSLFLTVIYSIGLQAIYKCFVFPYTREQKWFRR